MTLGGGQSVTLVRWEVWADLVDDKTLWQEQAAGAEVNTQTETGVGGFFGPRKTKMTSLWAILAALQK